MTDDQTMYVCPRVATCPFQNCDYHRIFREKHAEFFFNPETCPSDGIPLDTLVVVIEERELANPPTGKIFPA